MSAAAAPARSWWQPRTRASAPSLAQRLVPSIGLTPSAAVRVERVYLDTYGWQLFHDDQVLVHEHDVEGDTLVLQDRARERSDLRVSVARRPTTVAELPDSLRRRLARSVSSSGLMEVGREDVEVWPLRLFDDEGKTVARVDVERVANVASPPTVRVQLSPMRGYPAVARQVRAILDSRADLVAADDPLIVAARAAGGDPGRTPRHDALALPADADARSTLAAVLGQQLETVVALENGVSNNLAPEMLHEFRIAIRRTRSVVRLAKRHLPDKISTGWAAEWRWLAGLTSTPRDLDVLLAAIEKTGHELPTHTKTGLDELVEVLVRQRESAQEKLTRALAGDRYGTLKRGWRYELDEIRASASSTDDTAKVRTASDLASDLIARATKQLARGVELVHRDAPAEYIHDARKEVKRLRYALDLFGSLVPGATVKATLKATKRLQNELGEFQDNEVQRDRIARILELGKVSPDAVEAGHVLIARYDANQLAVRTALEERVRRFHAPKPTR